MRKGFSRLAEAVSPISEADKKRIAEREEAEKEVEGKDSESPDASGTTPLLAATPGEFGPGSTDPSSRSGLDPLSPAGTTPPGSSGGDPSGPASTTPLAPAPSILAGLFGGAGSGSGPLGGPSSVVLPPIMAAPTPPRIGGNAYPDSDYTTTSGTARPVSNAAFYCGGTQTDDATIRSNGAPIDILAHRPDDFRSKQKQIESIKKGLNDALKLELPKNGKLQVPVMTWVNEMKNHLITRGLEPVFCVSIEKPPASGTYVWFDLLVSFGDITAQQIKVHIDRLTAAGTHDKWDDENFSFIGKRYS